MRYTFLLSTVLTLLMSAHVARAGVYLEPLAGYQQGSSDYQYKAALGGTSDKNTITGLAYGVDLGYIFNSGFRLALEFEMANQEIKTDSTSVIQKWKTTSYGLVVGYEFPEKIVGYLGVGMASSVDDATPKTTVSGMVLRAGGSREFFNHVAVSVEYRMYTWNESAVDGGTTTKFSDAYEKYNSYGIQANIRFPFEFGGK